MPTYFCPYCGKNFPTLSDFTDHRDATHPDADEYKYRCVYYTNHEELGVPSIFKTKEDLYWHKVNVHGETPTLPYACPFCSERFASQEEVDSHVAYSHPVVTWYCPYCCIEFDSEEEYDAHMAAEHTTVPTYRCPYCGLEFPTKAQLDAHKAAKHVPTPPPPEYDCPYCAAVFNTADQLEQHIEDQHPTEPPPEYECPYCGATFDTADQLEQHIEDQHPTEPPPSPPGEFPWWLLGVGGIAAVILAVGVKMAKDKKINKEE